MTDSILQKLDMRSELRNGASERFPLRPILAKANMCNPMFRPVYGFQEPFKATTDEVVKITADFRTADIFDLIFVRESLEIYRYQNKELDCDMKLIDSKFIASIYHELEYEWLVVQGLLVAHHESIIPKMERQGKLMLIRAIRKEWGIDLRRIPQ